MRGCENRLSQELLLDEDLEDDENCSFSSEVTDGGFDYDDGLNSLAKSSEEILCLREQNGMMCRQFPVKETTKLVRSEVNGLEVLIAVLTFLFLEGKSYENSSAFLCFKYELSAEFGLCTSDQPSIC